METSNGIDITPKIKDTEAYLSVMYPGVRKVIDCSRDGKYEDIFSPTPETLPNLRYPESFVLLRNTLRSVQALQSSVPEDRDPTVFRERSARILEYLEPQLTMVGSFPQGDAEVRNTLLADETVIPMRKVDLLFDENIMHWWSKLESTEFDNLMTSLKNDEVPPSLLSNGEILRTWLMGRDDLKTLPELEEFGQLRGVDVTGKYPFLANINVPARVHLTRFYQKYPQCPVKEAFSIVESLYRVEDDKIQSKIFS